LFIKNLKIKTKSIRNRTINEMVEAGGVLTIC
jgi:hypothetical protein